MKIWRNGSQCYIYVLCGSEDSLLCYFCLNAMCYEDTLNRPHLFSVAKPLSIWPNYLVGTTENKQAWGVSESDVLNHLFVLNQWTVKWKWRLTAMAEVEVPTSEFQGEHRGSSTCCCYQNIHVLTLKNCYLPSLHHFKLCKLQKGYGQASCFDAMQQPAAVNQSLTLSIAHPHFYLISMRSNSLSLNKSLDVPDSAWKGTI